jgi:hypothetical protein
MRPEHRSTCRANQPARARYTVQVFSAGVQCRCSVSHRGLSGPLPAALGTDLLLSNERGSGICFADDAVALADDPQKNRPIRATAREANSNNDGNPARLYPPVGERNIRGLGPETPQQRASARSVVVHVLYLAAPTAPFPFRGT